MIENNQNKNLNAVKPPQSKKEEFVSQDIPQSGKDKLDALVEHYQNLDSVRMVQLSDKVNKYWPPNFMTPSRVGISSPQCC